MIYNNKMSQKDEINEDSHSIMDNSIISHIEIGDETMNELSLDGSMEQGLSDPGDDLDETIHAVRLNSGSNFDLEAELAYSDRSKFFHI